MTPGHYVANSQTLRVYRETYGVADSVTIDDVQQHLALEAALTAELLASEPANRWEVFERSYTRLYSDLPWLNQAPPPTQDFRPWIKLLRRPCKVFEVGSGRARLLGFLSAHGHDCTATEITRERGQKHLSDVDGVKWRQTDGVHLGQFERAGAFDVVISTQVVEHLHPDDILQHFVSARRILTPNGQYIFDTPHIGVGPHDLSQVIGLHRAVFMHLKEYDNNELLLILKQAGYRHVEAVVSKRGLVFRSAAAMAWFAFVDRRLRALKLEPGRERALRMSPLFRLLGPPANIWIAAQA